MVKIKDSLRDYYYCWKESRRFSSLNNVNKGALTIFLDMITCKKKYHVTRFQYADCQIYKLSEAEKKQVCEGIKDKRVKRDKWIKAYYNNNNFIRIYSDLKWEKTRKKKDERIKAYTKQYGFGENCVVQFGVKFIFEHYTKGKLIIGKNILFARDVDIDITGDLIICNNCLFSENVKILTHKHSMVESHVTIPTPLNIGEDVRFGARALVLPDVKRIGRGAMIAANAVVHHEIPPYSIVMGNPGKIVGFRFTPDQVIEYEEDLYSEEDRLDEEILAANYKKYYLDRITEISNYLK